MEEGSPALVGPITWTPFLLPCAGIQRFCRDIHMMLGFKPGLYFRACWLFLSPATLLVTWVGGKVAGWGPKAKCRSLCACSLAGLSWLRVSLCEGCGIGIRT